MIHRATTAVVRLAERRPWTIVLTALVLMASLFAYAARTLEVRTGLLELLPSERAGLRAFLEQRARAPGAASLVVIIESPDAAANRRLATDLDRTLRERFVKDPRVAFIEGGTHELRRFYEDHKWLYATLAELEDVDLQIDHTVARQSGLVEDLETGDAPATPQTGTHSADARHLGVRDQWERWKKRAADKDPYPTGYFATADDQLVGIRIVTTLGFADPRGDSLVADVRSAVDGLEPRGYHPQLAVGLTGEVATTSTERAAILNDAALATLIASGIILLGIALFFRSFAALLVIGLPAAFGVGCAYAFAAATYGYVNMVGAFLGAIVLGNGINYPIVLLARYGDFRGRGMTGPEARIDAVLNAFRAELVGALVAAIAYGSLSITDFRGFRQFGVVGFVGMLMVWIAIVPIVPALIVLCERHEARLPQALRWLGLAGARRMRGARARQLGRLVMRRPIPFIAAAVAISGFMMVPLARFLADPWEYDFGRLGSRHSDVHSVGWSDKADRVFGKNDIAGALVLAETPEQVPELEARMLERDRKDPAGPLLQDIVTLADYLPGTIAEQQSKIETLERIRERLTPGVIARLAPDEQELARELRPPDHLHAIAASDLPAQLTRRFRERDGRLGTVMYVQPRSDIALADAHVQLRLAATCDEVSLADGKVVRTASNATIISEIMKSLRRDGPLASGAALLAVIIVVLCATHDRRGAFVVIASLGVGLLWTLGYAAWTGEHFNYINFIAIPITCGIGCEYPFNLFDRVRLLGGNIVEAVARSAGPVLLCSFTTLVGYGSLMYSDVQALESFGRLAVVGELSCAFAAVLLLPALLRCAGRQREGDNTGRSEDRKDSGFRSSVLPVRSGSVRSLLTRARR